MEVWVPAFWSLSGGKGGCTLRVWISTEFLLSGVTTHPSPQGSWGLVRVLSAGLWKSPAGTCGERLTLGCLGKGYLGCPCFWKLPLHGTWGLQAPQSFQGSYTPITWLLFTPFPPTKAPASLPCWSAHNSPFHGLFKIYQHLGPVVISPPTSCPLGHSSFTVA